MTLTAELDASTLPSNWRVATIGEVCHVQLGKMLSPKSKTGERPVPYLRNANVQWNRFDLSDVVEMDFTEDQERKFELRPGDLLVCEGGEPGRAAIWEGQIERCCYQKALHRIRPIDDAVDPRFLMFRFWLGAQSGEFTDSQSQTTIAHLPAVRLRQLPIAIPPLGEQRRIAGILKEQMEAVERARVAAEAQLEAAKALPAAFLRDVFNAPEADTWSVRAIEDIATTCSGATPPRGDSRFFTGTIPWVKTGELVDGEIRDTEEHVSDTAIAETSLRLLPEDTLLIAMYGQGQTRGRTGLLRCAATTNQACFAILPNSEEFDSRFLQL